MILLILLTLDGDDGESENDYNVTYMLLSTYLLILTIRRMRVNY